MDYISYVERFIDALTDLSPFTAYAAILGVLLVCGLGVPIPEDVTLISAGILVSLDTLSMPGAMIAGFIGVMMGDAILFNLGRYYGRNIFRLPMFRHIFTPERIAKAEVRIRNNSKFICFTARFLPGLRAPIFLTAGVMGVRPMTFYLLDGAAALISVPVWIYAGYYFGSTIEEALGFAKNVQLYLLGAIGLLIALYMLFTWQRKRRLRMAEFKEQAEQTPNPKFESVKPGGDQFPQM